MTRGEIDGYTEFVKIYGAKGLAWIKVNDVAKGRDGLQSPIVKNLHDAALAAMLERTGAQNGDLIFFGADKSQGRQRRAGRLARQGRAQRIRQGAAAWSQGEWKPLWVVDFPMFEYDEDGRPLERRASPVHLARRTATKTGSRPIRAAASPRPTTWC